MSADNYLLVVPGREEECEVYHLFASGDEDTQIHLKDPMFAGVRLEALEFAHKWANENVTDAICRT